MKFSSLCLAFIWLSGCAAPLSGGSFTARGFEHERLPFSIVYADPGKGLLIDADWQVGSHRVKGGKPAGYKGGEHGSKERVGLDFDGDDEADKTVSTAHRDLELSRKSKRGEITVFTEILDASWAEKHLSVMSRELVDRLAGLHLRFERTEQGVKASGFEVSTLVHDKLPIRVGGRDGYAVLVDVQYGKGDQDPLRMALVILPAAEGVHFRSNLGDHTFPVVHVLTMMSDKRDFADSMRGFERLLANIRFEGPAS